MEAYVWTLWGANEIRVANKLQATPDFQASEWTRTAERVMVNIGEAMRLRVGGDRGAVS